MAVITSVVLVAPIVGPLSGAALMHFIHWKALFGIIAAMGLVAWLGLLLTMPETVRRGDVPFSPVGVLRDFRNVFRNRIFFTRRRHAVAELYSADELGGGIAGDFNGRRRTDHQRVRLEPVPVFSAVIIANLSVARWVKTPPARALSSARCRYRCSARPS